MTDVEVEKAKGLLDDVIDRDIALGRAVVLTREGVPVALVTPVTAQTGLTDEQLTEMDAFYGGRPAPLPDGVVSPRLVPRVSRVARHLWQEARAKTRRHAPLP